jgi:hypothetical protein
MIGNKEIGMLIFASLLTLVALVYGFLSVPNPAEQRTYKLDHRRVSDLGELQHNIDAYYQQNQKLPSSLDVLTSNTYSYSTPLNKKDPETNNFYEYSVTSSTSYTLCAVFKTDSAKEEAKNYDFYDEGNYSYSSFRDKFKHGIGHTCFPLSVTPTPTAYPLPIRGAGVKVIDFTTITPSPTQIPNQ